MKLSAEGLELIKQFEGFRSQQYRDVAGLPTIGYGHRIVLPESFTGKLSEADGAALLAKDVKEAEEAVSRLVKVPLTEGQFDALVDFCFNLGSGRLAGSTLLRCLNGGRYDDAAEQLLRWDLVAGEVNLGLKARREAEVRMWKAGAVACEAAAA